MRITANYKRGIKGVVVVDVHFLNRVCSMNERRSNGSLCPCERTIVFSSIIDGQYEGFIFSNLCVK